MWPFKKKQPEPECPYKLEPAPEPEPESKLPEPPKRDLTTTKKNLCKIIVVGVEEPLMLDVEETGKLKHEHETQAIGLVEVHPYRKWMDLAQSWYYRTTVHEPFYTRSYSTLTVNSAMIATIGEPYEQEVLLSAENHVAVQEETPADTCSPAAETSQD